MLINLTAFAEAFSMYLCHLTAGIAADADNRFHIESNFLNESYSAGETEVDATDYHAALRKRDETHNQFIFALRRYRVTTNSTLSDEEIDFLVHQRQQEWIVDNALRLSAKPSVWDATRDVWINGMAQPSVDEFMRRHMELHEGFAASMRLPSNDPVKSYVVAAIMAPDEVGRSDILRDSRTNIEIDVDVNEYIEHFLRGDKI